MQDDYWGDVYVVFQGMHLKMMNSIRAQMIELHLQNFKELYNFPIEKRIGAVRNHKWCFNGTCSTQNNVKTGRAYMSYINVEFLAYSSSVNMVQFQCSINALSPFSSRDRQHKWYWQPECPITRKSKMLMIVLLLRLLIMSFKN